MHTRGIVAVLAALVMGACTHSAPAYTGRLLPITDSVLCNGRNDTLRLGRMYAGQTATATVTLRNDTAAPVVIESYDTTCGCASLQYTGSVLHPTEQKTVECLFDSTGESGWKVVLLRLKLAGHDATVNIYLDSEVE